MGTLRAALAVAAVAALITAGLLVSAPAGAVELVANPGFESGLAGWACTAETGAGTQAHTGVRALTGTPNATTAECAQTIPVTAGAAYTLTAWVNGAFVFLGASGTSTGEVSTWTPGTAGVAPAVVSSALTCLAQGVGCGTFRPPTTWPAIRGAMTWSVNWDQVQGYAFADTVAPALDRLP